MSGNRTKTEFGFSGLKNIVYALLTFGLFLTCVNAFDNSSEFLINKTFDENNESDSTEEFSNETLNKTKKNGTIPKGNATSDDAIVKRSSNDNCSEDQFLNTTTNLCQNLRCIPPDGTIWNHTCVNCTSDANCDTKQTCNLTAHKCQAKTPLLPNKREYFLPIILMTAITSIFILLFILWASQRDIEGNIIPQKHYFIIKQLFRHLPAASAVLQEESKQKQREILELGKHAAFISGLFITIITFFIIIIVEGFAILHFFPDIIIYFLILSMLIIFFTTIFAFCLKGYVSSLLIGFFSGLGVFLIFLIKVFSILDIDIGVVSIPLYMPASSFLGVLAYVFVSLYYDPSKIYEGDDDKRVRAFLARFVAAILLGIAVYVVLQPVAPSDNDTTHTAYWYAFFGFASGFYISQIVHFLRRKIIMFISEEGFREDERNRIIINMENNPEGYTLLSVNEIKKICDDAKIDEDEFKKRIDFIRFIGVNASKILADKGIKSFEDLMLVSEDKINKIIDKVEYKKIVAYIKILGAEKVRNLSKKGIGYKEFLNISDERIKELCSELKINEDEFKNERGAFTQRCTSIENEFNEKINKKE